MPRHYYEGGVGRRLMHAVVKPRWDGKHEVAGSGRVPAMAGS